MNAPAAPCADADLIRFVNDKSVSQIQLVGDIVFSHDLFPPENSNDRTKGVNASTTVSCPARYIAADNGPTPCTCSCACPWTTLGPRITNRRAKAWRPTSCRNKQASLVLAGCRSDTRPQNMHCFCTACRLKSGLVPAGKRPSLLIATISSGSFTLMDT
jgi:hypothetical protein